MHTHYQGALPKLFCNGIDRIELIGCGCVRFTLYEYRAIGVVRRSPNGEVIVPLAALPLMIRQARACLLWGGTVPAAKLPLGQIVN
jgi:hypothetical protein